MIIEAVAIIGLILANVICYLCHDKSLLRGRLKGPNLLFISNRSSKLSNKLPRGYWALDVLEPAHLVSSFVLNDVWVLLLRVFHLAYFALTLLLEGLTGDGFGNPLGWFTFFTNWTFLLFGIWSLLGVALTGWAVQAKLSLAAAKVRGSGGSSGEAESLTGGAFSSSTSDAPASSSLQLKWGPLSVAYLFVSETTAACTLFLSLFYWTFLFSPKSPLQIDNLLKHGVNNLVLLADVLLCRAPFVSYHFQVAMLYGTVYTVFMWAYHAASLRWVYYVLDWSQPTALVLYLLNPLFLFAAFAFWYVVARCREWVGHKFSPEPVPSSRPSQVDFQ